MGFEELGEVEDQVRSCAVSSCHTLIPVSGDSEKDS